MVNNCWSEGSYELGIEALNAFRAVDKRYPTPSHMRHLVALALYPPPPSTTPKPPAKPRHRTRPSTSSLSPRKPNLHQAATEIPSARASHLALELLTVLASTIKPELLVKGLSSYTSRPSLDEEEGQGKKSPLVDEVVKIGKTRDCWSLVKEGLLVRRDQIQFQEEDSDSDDGGGEHGRTIETIVGSYSASVKNWCTAMGRASAVERGCLCVQNRRTERTIYRSENFTLINATSTFAVAPAILVRATTDQVQTLTSTAFRSLIQDVLRDTRGEFPLSLYSRFGFCIAALYLARSGSGTTERGVFGAVTSGKKGPRARPRVSLGGMGEQAESHGESQGTGESQMESQSMLGPAHSEARYPYPSPSLETIQALLKSTPKEPGEEKFGMHAIARWTILSALMPEVGWAPAETWISANDLEDWVVGVSDNMRAGFEADARAGAHGALWSLQRELCEMLLL
ncbi:hypothetical protein RhiJN_10564 [Ceratobasidium sp. AG-Ba]|nr:hypothetical protein RhiJN_10564 [Ceratobasidium sp. AG-Ba]